MDLSASRNEIAFVRSQTGVPIRGLFNTANDLGIRHAGRGHIKSRCAKA
jgi:hypothetical protein